MGRGTAISAVVVWRMSRSSKNTASGGSDEGLAPCQSGHSGGKDSPALRDKARRAGHGVQTDRHAGDAAQKTKVSKRPPKGRRKGRRKDNAKLKGNCKAKHGDGLAPAAFIAIMASAMCTKLGLAFMKKLKLLFSEKRGAKRKLPGMYRMLLAVCVSGEKQSSVDGRYELGRMPGGAKRLISRSRGFSDKLGGLIEM